MKALGALGVALAVSVALSLPAANPAVAVEARVTVAESATALGDFELTDQLGQAMRFSSLRGQLVLVFFGFTHCPSICPTAMGELRLLTDALRQGGAPVPKVVMISVDGERDTPAVMKAYLEPQSQEFIGLTGDPRRVRDIAARFSAVFFKGIPGDNSGNYQVQHTSLVYLVDAGGALRASFLAAPLEQMAELIRKVAGAPAKES